MGPVRFNDINFSETDSYDKWKSYGQSKTANIYMASAIERHYGSQGLHAWSVHPGGIQTELGRHLDKADYERLGVDKFQHIFKSQPQGAATTVWAATTSHFEGKNGGRYLAECSECGPMAEGAQVGAPGYAEHIYIKENEEKLWDMSYEMLGLAKDY